MRQLLVLLLAFSVLAAPLQAATRMNTRPSDDNGVMTNQVVTTPTPAPRSPPDITPQKDLLLKSQATLESLLSDPDFPALLNLVRKAKAVLIVPSMLKFSFFL
ncbi:MAG TPA: hypothetical protein VHB73_05120, partial [Alphaproteobacteria bacterium]|nr:hypothetical protein [Alphaproteobacteria bacterium]